MTHERLLYWLAGLALVCLVCGVSYRVMTPAVTPADHRAAKQLPAPPAAEAPPPEPAKPLPLPQKRRPRKSTDVRASMVDLERSLIAQLRRLQFTDPEQSVDLAASFDERFPTSPRAPERAWYLARNLVYLGRFDAARQVAQEALAEFPNDSWSRDLQRHLLSHPFGLRPRNH